MLPRHLFAHPWLLWALAALPVLAVLGWWARRRRRRDLTLLAGMSTLERLRATGRGRRRLGGLGLTLGLALLAVGAAGPQWGREPEVTALGRDLIVILDVSKSMRAEQPSRLERARRALADLTTALRKRGGHRVALVAFAARSSVVCPLTHDYDHFREAVESTCDSPDELGLGPVSGDVSGTRFGAGIDGALEARDPRYPGYCDVLFLSDGDDPARDRSWHAAAVRARAAGVPIHTIGIGDPSRDTEVRDEKVVGPGRKGFTTRLREGPLQDIAQETQGTYLGARTEVLKLGRVYLDRIATLPLREDADDALLGYRQQYGWFLLPAFGLLALAMALTGRAGR
jgi:Ca-activated chloride channel family protein